MAELRWIDHGRKVTLVPWETAVVFDRDGSIREVGGGYHSRKRTETWHIVDTRPSWLTVAPQEVLTADSLQLRVTPVVRYRITDASLWVTGTQSSGDSLYVLSQLAIRQAIATRALDEVISLRTTILTDARVGLTETAAALGAEILEFEIRDVTLPAELRHALAETALAKEQGRARLERARAEAAAMRSLANTAQLLEQHPSLLDLRAIEAAGTSGQFVVRIGNTGPAEAS